ncbi:MAG: virulence RhuM family protein [Endomicrobium sp.]|jgi:prophage maintenance system killer protein|uniref:RhuM family protein n=1 Tax=Candidatus Endomicrobiellum cubanum TaxID=3242325 RepID=UPI00283456BB|nr:virulence RhuM family protein [Endomicrobium sp.]
MYKNNCNKNTSSQPNIVIYKNKIEVKLEENTLWLTQEQISSLFQTTRNNVTMHIANIFEEKELSKCSVCKKFLHAASDGKKYNTKFYNLDMIISIGYRIKSLKATQFRIWATNVLRKHLVDGYTINEKRLQESQSKYYELQKILVSLSNNINKFEDISKETKGILQVLAGYSKALEVLDKYDHQNLEKPKGMKREKYKLTYKKAKEIVNAIKAEFSDSTLVGHEREHGFESIINDIYQTFGGEDVYPTVQEKAANLLYLITKNHSFSDGNKRIAATLFITYLKENNLLFKQDGTKAIDNNALAALTLMVATSNPKEKDMITKIILNLL